MTNESTAVLAASDQEALRAVLLRLREENVHDLTEAQATLATLVEDGTRGTASMREVEANAEYMVKDASEIIRLIDAALARMEAGTYGVCTGCQRAIPLERLELRPYGATCVPCGS